MLNLTQRTGQNTGKHDRAAAMTQADQARRTDQRSHSDLVLSLASYLRDDERFLIEQVFEHGLRLSDIARQQGKNRSTMQYHVKQILRRMGNPLFRFLVAHEDVLPKPVRLTGRRVIFEGHSLREAARLRRISLHAVRQHMQTIQSLARL